MKMLSIRAVDLFAFFVCCALLSIALFLQIHVGLIPCPLCTIQRLIVTILGFLFLIGALLNPYFKWRRAYHSIIFLTAATGITAAGRQVWLQSLPPDQVTTCGASLHYLLQILPLNQVLLLVFQGAGECAKVTWRLLGLSMAGWTLVFFSIFALLALWQVLRKS